jgi:Rrf2 family protein
MLSKTTEYALQALIYLAMHRDREPILAREISDNVQIPRNYLSKILHGMKRSGFLEAERGKTGGYRLARDPKHIRISDVVDLFESLSGYDHCFLSKSPCSKSAPCAAHKEWRPIAGQVLNFMRKTTLANLIQ